MTGLHGRWVIVSAGWYYLGDHPIVTPKDVDKIKAWIGERRAGDVMHLLPRTARDPRRPPVTGKPALDTEAGPD